MEPDPRSDAFRRSAPEAGSFDADVVVIGSGFGGAVAALRWSERGERVVVLERGGWVRRDEFEADIDAFWSPRRHRFGMNELRPRGRHVIPWLGAAVGGGSHVYAATLKRRDSFADFPAEITREEMERHYERAEAMMGATPYPDYPPYSEVRATQLFFQVGERLAREAPELVEAWGPIQLGISFAPPGGEPGAHFVNAHGAPQCYSDPSEHSLLGGDIDAKNSLDRNYLFLAGQLGAEVRPFCEADRIEPLPGGGFSVGYRRYAKEESRWRRLVRHWLPWLARDRDVVEVVRARRVVVSAGAIGSTELLLRSRGLHGTLTGLSPRLGERYTTNGDFISLMFPSPRSLLLGWLGVAAFVAGLVLPSWPWMIAGALAYGVALVVSRPPYDPDIGTTNSDYIRFRHRDGTGQGAYVEGGRYPTPVRGLMALALSLMGHWRPSSYGSIVRVTDLLRRWIPPFALLARSWPIPLLKMGRDDATGVIALDPRGRATIDYDWAANREFYAYLDRLGKRVARAAGAGWMPNGPAYLTKKVEIPHNLGGVPMGRDSREGVVDHAGRVFRYEDLMVLDGSIIPVSLGPNPALTILALAERAMEIVGEQVDRTGVVRPAG